VSAAKTKQFPVTLLWQIAANKEGETQHKIDEVVQLGQKMFPGINWWWSQTNTVATQVIAPELRNLFKGLADHPSEAEAVKALGETVEVPKVRSIKGYSWTEALEKADCKI